MPAAATATSNNNSLNNWTCAQVIAFLEKHDLGQYSNLFRASNVDGAVMCAITDEALKDIGITNAIDRCRIIGKFNNV